MFGVKIPVHLSTKYSDLQCTLLRESLVYQKVEHLRNESSHGGIRFPAGYIPLTGVSVKLIHHRALAMTAGIAILKSVFSSNVHLLCVFVLLHGRGNASGSHPLSSNIK